MAPLKKVFIVGIKGVAMTHIAVMLKKMGVEVEGVDVPEEFITDHLLREHHIRVSHDFDVELVPDQYDSIIYSGAHQGDRSSIVLSARNNNIPVMHQSEFLGSLLPQFATSIGVCGTHGKTSTSSMLTYALMKLGKHPSYLIGSSSFNDVPGSDFDGRDYFVIEADEYGMNPPHDRRPKFHFLHTTYALCTTIGFDHPDVYESIEDTKKAFVEFFQGKKKIFACADDRETMTILRQNQDIKAEMYGFSLEADLRIIHYKTHPEGLSFDVTYRGQLIKNIRTSVYGEKNALNAAGVVLTLINLGMPVEAVRESLVGFVGAKRRLEQKYYKNDTYLIDDYAHHPDEIAATIAALRARFEARRLLIIFQPHTFSRTEALRHDFAHSFQEADRVLLAPIFASARENSALFNITSLDLEKESRKAGIGHVKSFESKEELVAVLASILRPKDVVVTMGAGDIYKLDRDIIKAIDMLELER